jgi:uncharacterized protein DUF5819
MPTRHATVIPSRGRRGVVVAIAAVAVVHSALVAVWVMPTNPIRDAIGAGRVDAYINNGIVPFEQSWSVFAPTPRRGGESVQVRAYNGETGTTTAWFDITADEDDRIRHVPNPSRIHTVTRRLGGGANEQLADLTETQLDLVSSDTPSRREMLRRLPDDYVDLEEMLTRFGTMYAIARWGDDVTMVQIKIGHRRVPAFANRARADFLDVPFSYRTLGWRKALRGDADAQAAFDGYVERAPEKGG